jgi:hypothetical protein
MGITFFGAEYFTVISHHVEVQAVGCNRVATNQARQGSGGFGDWLFQQSPGFYNTLGTTLFRPTFRAWPTAL